METQCDSLNRTVMPKSAPVQSGVTMDATVVIVVEDEPFFHDVLRRLFRHWRFVGATSVAAAKRELKTEERVDLVILDYQLKGDETTEELCVWITEQMPGVPIIVYSGHEDGIDRLRSIGAVRQLKKPAPNHEIRSVVRKVVGIDPDIEPPPSAPTIARDSRIEPVAPPDARPVAAATVGDLNFTLIEQHIVEAIKAGRYTGTPDVRQFLVEQHCLVENTPTRAGLLMFGIAPERFIKGAAVEVVATDDAVDREGVNTSVFGTLPEMIEQILEAIKAWSPQHGDEHEYPPRVLRELATNALCHRDWYLDGRVRVILGRGKIGWLSPGGLPHRVTKHTIGEDFAPRNPTIANLLRQAGYGAQIGQGWNLIAADLERNGNRAARIIDAETQVRVEIEARAIAIGRAPASRAPHGLQAQPAPSTNEFSPERRHASILAFCEQAPAGVSPKQIKQHLSDIPERTIERDLNDLVRAGLLFEEGSTRRRVYRVPKGSAA